MENLLTLAKVLQSADDLPWNEAVYLPKDKRWTLASPSAVWSPDDLEEGEEEPEIARKNDLSYALLVSAIQDIVANAREQKPSCALDELLEAFLFYYKNDAFITFK